MEILANTNIFLPVKKLACCMPYFATCFSFLTVYSFHVWIYRLFSLFYHYVIFHWDGIPWFPISGLHSHVGISPFTATMAKASFMWSLICRDCNPGWFSGSRGEEGRKSSGSKGGQAPTCRRLSRLCLLLFSWPEQAHEQVQSLNGRNDKVVLHKAIRIGMGGFYCGHLKTQPAIHPIFSNFLCLLGKF